MHADDILAETLLCMARHRLLKTEWCKVQIDIEIVGELFCFRIEERLLFGDRQFKVVRSLAVLGNKELTKSFLGGKRIVGAVRCELRIVPAAEMDSDYAFGEPFTLQPRYDLAQDIVHVREIDLGAVRNPWPAAIAIRFFVLARKMPRVHMLPFADARRPIRVAPYFVRMFFGKFRVCRSVERENHESFRRNAHHIADITHRTFDIPDSIRPMPRTAHLKRLKPHTLLGETAAIKIPPGISPAVRIFIYDRCFLFPIHQKAHPAALLHNFRRMLIIGSETLVKCRGIFKVGLPCSVCRVSRPKFLPCRVGGIVVFHAPTVPYRNRRRPGDYQRR